MTASLTEKAIASSLTDEDIVSAQRAWLDRLRAFSPSNNILCVHRPKFDEKWHAYPCPHLHPVSGRTVLPNELLFDFDQDDWKLLKLEAGKLVKHLNYLGVPHLVGYTGGKGVHIHVFMDLSDVDIGEELAGQLKELGIDVARAARLSLFEKLSAEAGLTGNAALDRQLVAWSGSGRGHLVREFGCVRESGTYKTILTEIPEGRPNAGEVPLIVPTDVPVWRVPVSYATELIGSLEAAVTRCATEEPSGTGHSGPLCDIPCYRKLMDGMPRGKRNEGAFHIARFNWLMGVTEEDARKEIEAYTSRCEDSGPALLAECLAALSRAYRGKIKKPSCTGIKQLLGEEHCDRGRCSLVIHGDEKVVPKAAKRPGEPNIAKKLVEMALSDRLATLFRTPLGEPYIQLWRQDHFEVRALDESFMDYLANEFWKRERDVPNPSAKRAALETLRAMAKEDGEVNDLSIRVARPSDEEIYYDLADPDWRAVRINSEGWSIVDAPGILFRRTPYTFEQVEPVRGRPGSLDELLDLINIRDWQMPMVKALFVADLLAGREQIGVFAKGGEGSGKSSLTRAEKALIDPQGVDEANVSQDPSRDEDLELLLTQVYIAAIDNVSRVSAQRSDLYCVSVTGGMRSRRAHFRDREMVRDCYRCALRLNGISNPISRPDALERMIIFNFSGKPPRPMSKSAWWNTFNRLRPYALAELFDLASHALKIYHSWPEPESSPRMGEWYRWAEAAAVATGSTREAFAALFRRFEEREDLEALEQDQLTKVLINVAEDGPFLGTASELLEVLNGKAFSTGIDVKDRGWPKRESVLGKRLERLQVVLGKFGYELVHGLTARELEERLPELAVRATAYRRTDRMIVLRKKRDAGVGNGGGAAPVPT